MFLGLCDPLAASVTETECTSSPDEPGCWAAQALGLPGTAPEKCTAEVMHAVVQQHMDSPAMWAIFPLQARAPPFTDKACSRLQSKTCTARDKAGGPGNAGLAHGCRRHARGECSTASRGMHGRRQRRCGALMGCRIV